MHIVLSGYYGFDNVGDEAILFSIIRALRDIQEDVDITVLSNNPEATKQTYGVQAVNRWKIKEVRNVLKHADGLISGGGSLLQDQTGMKSIPYYTGVIQIARMHKTPVFIYAQGMGPINHRVSRWIVKLTLNKVNKITVRDEDSKTLLEDIGIQKQITVVPDPVLGLDGTSFSSNWFAEQNISASFVTVSVRDWETSVLYKEKIASCLDEIVRSGDAVVFVPMHGEHDERSSSEVAGLMKEKSFISPAHALIEEKIALIGQSKLLIGMRLHSLIFSAITHTPFIAISYDPKIDAFASIADQPVVGHVEKNNWNEGKLFAKVEYMLANEAEAREALKCRIDSYQKEAAETSKLAVETFMK
ncbi:polysaccharide pyruvyl transferase CsaB [Oceanobacillus sp. CF4.6]|uniref:polysaccharide pyruvyl transferase CsaB n=1 Tax=Oceanobacillus sp. CF4.6 TaxID=3373080 RepID=UPI003EE65B0F